MSRAFSGPDRISSLPAGSHGMHPHVITPTRRPGRAFREVFVRLDDPTSARSMVLFNVVDESWSETSLQADLDAQKGKSTIALDAAVALVRDYEGVQAYRGTKPLREALIAEDDSRRYVMEKNIQVKTSDRATVCALAVRPKGSTGRCPRSCYSRFTIPSSTTWTMHGCPRHMATRASSDLHGAKVAAPINRFLTSTTARMRHRLSTGSRNNPGATVASACTRAAITASPSGPRRNTYPRA